MSDTREKGSRPQPRVVVTGLAVNTPLADEVGPLHDALCAGQSAVSVLKSLGGVDARTGADLSDYDSAAKLASLTCRGEARSIPAGVVARARKLLGTIPWSVKLSVLLAIDAWSDAQAFAPGINLDDTGIVLGGHNLHQRYHCANYASHSADPEHADLMYGVHLYDTTHLGCISYVLQMRGPASMSGAACATGLHAVRSAMHEVQLHGCPMALVVSAAWDFASLDLDSMEFLKAAAPKHSTFPPWATSRPFDVRREGFVPAHGAAAIVIEDLEHALRRGANIYAELLSVEATSDASYMPQPSEDGQARAMARALSTAGLQADDIDYISGHFTSTIVGDLSEARAINRVFGDHARRLKVNATKSLLGHTMGASGLVELVAAITQMRRNRLHPSVNVEEQDPGIELDVCRSGAVDWPVRAFMKNSFGFGGLNACAVVSAFDSGSGL